MNVIIKSVEVSQHPSKFFRSTFVVAAGLRNCRNLPCSCCRTVVNSRLIISSIAMRKLISFFHISLDGFVAGPNGEMNWIKVDESIFDYVGEQIRETDTALYGRVTWQMMESYWPTAGQEPGASKHDIEHSAWYAKVNKIVLSKSLANQNFPNTTIIAEEVQPQINHIKSLPGSDILIFGSPSATHSLLEDELIDGFWLFVNPLILGHGIPAFRNVPDLTRLRLVKSKSFENGVVFLHYEKASSPVTP